MLLGGIDITPNDVNPNSKIKMLHKAKQIATQRPDEKVFLSTVGTTQMRRIYPSNWK